MRSFGCFVELCALLKQHFINIGMSLSGRDILDSTVPILMFVPEDKVIHPTPSCLDTLKRFTRISRAVFQGSEQTFRVRIIITHRSRLNDGTTPSRCEVASMVTPFIGPPLSACNINRPRLTP